MLIAEALVDNNKEHLATPSEKNGLILLITLIKAIYGQRIIHQSSMRQQSLLNMVH